MTLRILAAGQMRSGSTWQYNVLRELSLLTRGNVYGAWIEDYDPGRPEDIHIIKIHDPPALNGLSWDLAFTAYRDLRDVAASYQRMGWRKLETLAQIRAVFDTYVANLAAWEKNAARVMRYETMMADRLAEIRRTAEAMGLDLTEDQVAQINRTVLAIRQPGDRPTGAPTSSDPVSQLHPGHIGQDGAALGKKTRFLIDCRYGKWLAQRDYQLGWAVRLMRRLYP